MGTGVMDTGVMGTLARAAVAAGVLGLSVVLAGLAIDTRQALSAEKADKECRSPVSTFLERAGAPDRFQRLGRLMTSLYLRLLSDHPPADELLINDALADRVVGVVFIKDGCVTGAAVMPLIKHLFILEKTKGIVV